MAKRRNRAANQFGKLKTEMEQLNVSLKELIANQQASAQAATATAQAAAAAAKATEERQRQADERTAKAENAANERRAAAEKKRATAAAREREGILERIKLINQEADAATSVSDRHKALLELHDEELNLLQMKRQQLKEQGEDLTEIENKIKKNKNETKNLNTEFEKSSKSVEDIFNSFSSLAKGDILGGLKGIGKTLSKEMGEKAVGKLKDGLGGLVKTIKGGGAAGVGAAAALVGLGTSLLALGAVVKIVKGIASLAVELVNGSSAFMKATGASREFAGSLVPITAELRKVGLSTKEASESFQVLFSSVSDFTMMSAAAREEMTKNAAVMASLGVSNEDFARGSQIAIKAMGQTGAQAAATQREIAALGMDIGVAPSKMAADFANAGPQLAKFGSDGVQTFKDLAVAAKVTGIEVNRLMSITGQFDTFEGAATAAGKLNAALGGNFVNAMELVTATDPVERFNMIRDSILDAGLSFDEMSYYQRKFFAESAGLEGEAELAALMSGNMDSLAGNIGKTSKQYADMAERSKQVQSIQEKFNTIMMQLIPVFTPLVDLLVDFTEFLSENSEAVAKFVKIGIYVLGALGVVLGVVAIAMSSVATGIAAVIGGLTALASMLFIDNYASSFLEGLFKVSNGFESIGSAAAAAANPVTGLMKAGSTLADTLFGNDGIKVGAEVSARSIEKMDVAAASAASTSRAAAPTIATTNAVTNALNNSTSNNYGNSGDTKVNINFANKRFKDFFDVEVENSIGRAARKAVI